MSDLLPVRIDANESDAPDISEVDPDRHPDPGWNLRDEVMRWLLHGHSLSDPKDLLIPFFGN
jgi:hypothetical protein